MIPVSIVVKTGVRSIDRCLTDLLPWYGSRYAASGNDGDGAQIVML